MIILRFVILILVFQLPAVAFSADIKRIATSSHITSVTIFADRAQTTRTTTINLKPGSYLIAFEGMPPLVLDDSIRVDGKGTAAVTIGGLEIKRAFLAQSGEKRFQEIQDEIRSLEKVSAALDARKSGVAAQKAFLESIRVAWGDRISKELAIARPSTSELLDASNFVGSGVTKAEEQNREIDSEKRTLKDKIDALRRQQNEVSGSGRKETKMVEVSVEVAREGTLTLELVSMISQAGWEPAYDVRLANDMKTAALTFQAMMRQQTGEDWNNVDVTLSTARPAVGGAPPELYQWNVSLYRPQPMRSEMLMAAPAPYAKAKKAGRVQFDAAEQEEAVILQDTPVTFATSLIGNEQTSVSFHVPQRLDIPSDGGRHGTVVAIEQFPVNIEYLTVPKLSPSVFLKSEMTNRTAYPLLPGKINTFVGNRYTGSSQLKKVASGEKFDLFFGNDDQVTVKREELKQHKEAGIFSKNRVSYRYRIELGNFRKEPMTLTLRDQLPVAADEEIKVSLDEPSVKPEEIKSDGTVIWKMPLQTGEKREILFGIMIEYPKEREITGL